MVFWFLLSRFQSQSCDLTKDKFFELMPLNVMASSPVLKHALLASVHLAMFELNVSFGKASPHYSHFSKDL